MDRRVGRVLELLGHERVFRLLDERLGRVDRSLHSLTGRGQDQVRPHGPQQGPPLDRHRFRHREGQLVAFGGADKRERDSGVPAGRLDDVGLAIDSPFPFTGFDHCDADPVLDAIERLEEFALREHGRPTGGHEPVDLNHRRIANGSGRIGIGLSPGHDRLLYIRHQESFS